MVVTSAKVRIRNYLIENLGRVVTAQELSEVAKPVLEWARRVRELRDEEGWQILTNNDSTDLRPGEYILLTLPPETPDDRDRAGISQKLRAEVLDRDGFTCQMCGKAAGEIDEDTGRPVRLHIGHIVDRSLGGRAELSNLRALCSTCNQGAKNLTAEKPTEVWLLAQVRRAGRVEQQAVLDWLLRKFGDPRA